MGITAIVEVTENCNLECNFCLRPSFTPPVMKKEVLEEVISHILEYSPKRADFVWHGGEPLLAGLGFFESIPYFQKKYGKQGTLIKNNVQTNGLLLNKDYIDFFKREQFEISTSIQGTKETHDRARVMSNNRPTYDKLLSNLSKLNSKPGAIVVLTTDTLGKEKEIYESMKKSVKGMRVSEYFPGGLNPKNRISGNQFNLSERPDPLMPTSREYGESMLKFYDVWKNDPNPIDVRPFTEMIRSFILGQSEGCLYSQEACASSVIGVKSSGDFYTCIRGAPDKEHLMGSVKDKPLKNHFKSANAAKEARIAKLMEGDCGSCKYWNYCNGGCPLESFKIYGDLDHKTWYCEGRKMIFEQIYDDLTDSVPPQKTEKLLA